MSLRIREVPLTLDEDEQQLPDKIAALLGISPLQIDHWTILRRGIDARRKPNVLRIYTLEFGCADEEGVLLRNAELKTLDRPAASEPLAMATPVSHQRNSHAVVVGMGPAGLFSALALAEAGVKVTLLERGKAVEERLDDVRAFQNGGPLNPESNVQFGEGGAGTFSDGKLTCRLNHPATTTVLQRLVEFGAPVDILTQAKPHIGSDRLRKVLIEARKRLLALGVDIRFSSRLTGFESDGKRLTAALVNDRDCLPCDQLLLATGHSARDCYAMLAGQGVRLEPKAFAIGLRVEHPLELINRIQYAMPAHEKLPAADYRLAWNDPHSGRGVYSFCMCPGGVIVNASSEEGALVVNGMSNYRRADPWSNSALVVTVKPDDFGSDDLLAGIAFQRRWEQAAWRLGGSDWRAPAQPLMEFLRRKGSVSKPLSSSCQPGVRQTDLHQCLPAFVSQALEQALPCFDQRLRGFIAAEALLIGVETRTSAPLRILRDQSGQSVELAGLYPVGEGAGYAGGIMSAALDGMSAAQQILRQRQ